MLRFLGWEERKRVRYRMAILRLSFRVFTVPTEEINLTSDAKRSI